MLPFENLTDKQLAAAMARALRAYNKAVEINDSALQDVYGTELALLEREQARRAA